MRTYDLASGTTGPAFESLADDLDYGHVVTRLLTTVFRPGPYPFDNLYSIWDATTGVKIAALDDLVFSGWSGQGHSLFAAFTDLTAGVLDTDTMRRTSLSIPLTPVPSASATLAHGKFMALGYDIGAVAVIDVATGRPAFPRLRAASGVFQVTADANASRIYVSTGGSEGGLSVFDSTTGPVLAGNTEMVSVSVAVSRSGPVAIGRTDGTLGLYDPVTLRQVASLPGARGFMQQLQFSDDGEVLMGMGNDNSVSLYDVATATRIGDPIILPSVLTSWAALTPDGREMTTTYPEGGAVTIWDLDPEHWATAACAIAGRNLTGEEWTTYIGDLGSYRATCPQYSAAASGASATASRR
jgi:WD40 repeat protein